MCPELLEVEVTASHERYAEYVWLSSDLGCVSLSSVTRSGHQLRPSSQGCNMALIVLLLLLQQTHFSHQQTPFAPLDSSMRSLTMLARDFPSIEAVPDATFGEFQEVRLPEPRTPSPPPPPPSRNQPPTSPSPAPFTNFGQPSTRLPPRVGSPRPPSPPSPPPSDRNGLNIILTSAERREILDKLLGRDINSLVLTPLQRLAILQENEARQSQARPAQTTSRPTIRQENFQTTFRPETSPHIPRRQQTTIRPGPAFQTNFVRQQVNQIQISDNDENFDYIEDNEVSSKSMVEQTFSLFENFSNRINGGKPKPRPVSPFKRPSLRFLPEPPTKPPTTPRPPPTTPRPPPTTPRPPPTTPAPPTPQRERQVAKIRIKLPPKTLRQENEIERPRSFNNFPPRLEVQSPQNSRQQQIQQTTARPQSFPAVPQQTPGPTQPPPGVPRTIASRPPPSNTLQPRRQPPSNPLPPSLSNSLPPRIQPPSNSIQSRPPPPSSSLPSRIPPSPNSLPSRPPPPPSPSPVPSRLPPPSNSLSRNQVLVDS